MDQRKLIRKAKAGDTAAFTELYRTVYKKLYQYALYTLDSAEDAEDAVSETVLDAYNGMAKLQKEEAFDGWIFKILQAKCNHRIREYYDAHQTDSLEDVDVGSDDTAEQTIEREDLREAFSRIEPLDREIITMHVLLGYKTAEIAHLLALNENTVRSREARALKRLRATLGGYYE